MSEQLQPIPHEEQPETTTDGQEATTTAAPIEESAAPPSVEALQARIAELERENAELRDNWLRAVADYKNFKRRTDQERAELIRSASAALILKLLPVMDDLERAMAGVTPEVAETPWYSGFKLIPQKLQAILESEGVSRMQTVGEPFDPNRHEAIIYEPSEDGEDGKVIAELQHGYLLHDRVLRPAMVKVSQGKKQSSDSETPHE
ncbi:MAG: nucleotide exchange factor GrpE [Roseiflexus sp.]|jgi:molecular chaperone GrpE|nr:nucleotide exchange factor GrpE [Roseiflexus sp.]MBO9335735.1 nucleotide exchange factor GrpE [Roseiflexus sp.]MBO9364207.1 nucleotide exchange factor GrpE [Roseiflexus sp.]MBO9381478.1 nucleotide exchange factor GrpE [Roseiflexus sp.]MBO9388418.1 nucleotide exchange factor GrpE [Roseiflexus sp.]